MPVPEYAHDYKALMQDMAPAFEACKEYTLVDSEVEIVYLSLIRLQALEEAAMKRDWETVALYTPAPDDHGHSGALQRPDEVGSVARTGSPAKREASPQQSAEGHRSPAKREIVQAEAPSLSEVDPPAACSHSVV